MEEMNMETTVQTKEGSNQRWNEKVKIVVNIRDNKGSEETRHTHTHTYTSVHVDQRLSDLFLPSALLCFLSRRVDAKKENVVYALNMHINLHCKLMSKLVAADLQLLEHCQCSCWYTEI